MEISFRSFGIIITTLISCWACMEIHPLSPPKDPPKGNTTCQAPPIEKNIVGTWHFESTFNIYTTVPFDTTTSGVITFDAQQRIADPDSLFENRILGMPVTTKTYNPKVINTFSNYPGTLFEVYVTSKRGTQINYFTVVSNECNRIHLNEFANANNRVGFILTR